MCIRDRDFAARQRLRHGGVARPVARLIVRRDEFEREIVQVARMFRKHALDPDRFARAPEDRADQPARQVDRRDNRFAEIGRAARLFAIDRLQQPRRPPRAELAVAVVEGLSLIHI